jgi:hypothetical protein
MYQVKLFSGPTIEQMQHEINEWLSAHKDISIAHSGMNAVPAATKQQASFSFNILYTSSEARIEELKEMAAEVKPETSVEVTDINPDVMQATN